MAREATMAEMIAAVRKHAEARYDKGRGWDYVVEAWDDDDLERMLVLYGGKRPTTEKAAIRVIRKTAHLLGERDSEARAFAQSERDAAG